MTGRLASLLLFFGLSRGLGLCLGLCLGLAGCAGPVGLYHSAEGGAIAQPLQAPPGADAPYPNLANVPAAPVQLSASEEAAVGQRLAGTPGNETAAGGGVSAPSPEALAGLELPGAPPPTPDVPDLVIPRAPAAPAMLPVTAPPAATAPARPPRAPVALAFPPGSAVLDPDTAAALSGVAAAVGGDHVLVAGFGEAAGAGDAAAMTLALARARRLADALTADGVPASAINLLAASGGSGGFVQLFY